MDVEDQMQIVNGTLDVLSRAFNLGTLFSVNLTPDNEVGMRLNTNFLHLSLTKQEEYLYRSIFIAT